MIGRIVDKRTLIVKIMEQIDEWADENGIATSTIDQIELAERIYNMLRPKGDDSGEI